MIIHDYRLGQCASRAECLFKIKAWSHGARSFTITDLHRYNYSVATKHRNYFNFEVVYFSKQSEGKYQTPVDEIGCASGSYGRKFHKNRHARTKLIKNPSPVLVKIQDKNDFSRNYYD